MRNAQRLVDYAFVDVRAENLNPEHLSKRFYRGFRPLDEALQNIMSEGSTLFNKSYSQLATSFSLKLARNQSAVCLITVKTVIARLLM